MAYTYMEEHMGYFASSLHGSSKDAGHGAIFQDSIAALIFSGDRKHSAPVIMSIVFAEDLKLGA